MNYSEINLYIEISSADTFWFHIFSKYSENLYSDNLDIKSDILWQIQSYSENNEKFLKIKDDLTIKYKNYNLNIYFYEYRFFNEINDESNFYILCDYLYDFNNRIEELDSYNKIYYSIEEIPFGSTEYNKIDNFINLENFSLITTSNIQSKNNNVLYDYKISLIYFYYLLKFYHLLFDTIEVNKKDLVGCYYKKGYNKNRDEIFDKISKKINYTTYSVDYTQDTTTLFDLKYKDGWYGNHISSYVDYLKSVCNIIVETEVNDTFVSYYHCTEKTLKAILFSKLNIFFIYYGHYNLIKELIKDGFWFLNFEFLDVNNITKETVDESVIKSIDYLNKLQNEYLDYNEVHMYLKSKFGNKLQNNYEIFINLKESTYLSDKILDFIICKFNKLKNKHIL